MSNAYLQQGSRLYRAYVLAALLFAYIFSVTDRFLIGILQEPIRHEFGISDSQLGLLGGTAFALVYTTLSVPIARFAERNNRISIISAGCAVWSAMTALCGLPATFVQLVLARIGVGIGEAACTPASHSTISDYFPANRRAGALAIYNLGVPIGSIVAAVVGGWLGQNFGWRVPFLVLGGAGVALALLIRFTVREPLRTAGAGDAPSFLAACRVMLGKGSFWNIALGGAVAAFVGFGTGQFLPSYFIRTYHLSVSEASLVFGLTLGISVGIGIYAGGFLCDRLSGRWPGIYSWLSALGLLVATPLYLVALTREDPANALPLLICASIFNSFYIAPMYAVAQSIVEPRMRATASALLLLIVNLIGYALGPLAVGTASDLFAGGYLVALNGPALSDCSHLEIAACAIARADGLRSALMLAMAALPWSALHFFMARRALHRDWVG